MNNPTHTSARGHIAALACIVFWGTSFIVTKTLVQTITPFQVMLLRFTLAYAMLWILYPHWHFKIKEEGILVILALLCNTFYFMAENTALSITQASNVSILTSTSPIFSALLLLLVNKGERLTKKQGLAYLCAFLGVILVVLNGSLVLEIRPLGDLLAISTAIIWACYNILAKDQTHKYNGFLLARKLMFYAVISSAIVVAIEGKPVDFAGLMNPACIGGFLYLACLCSALCYVFWNYAIREIGILKTNIYLYAMPAVTLVAGIIVLDEIITPMGLAGMVLIAAGLLAGSGIKRRTQNEE